jgi:hypothetical protein
MGFWHNIFAKKVKNDQNVNVEEKTDEKTVENESTNICNTVEIKPEKTEEISNDMISNIINSEVVILPKNESASNENEASVVVDEAHEIEDDDFDFVPVTDASFITPKYTDITENEEGDFDHAII